MPRKLSGILGELMNESEKVKEKKEYYHRLIKAIVETGSSKTFIVALSNLIKKLAIAHLHVIGDIYDRGPGAKEIMDILSRYHSVDVQWGNHDILWMGAAAGSDACICNVIRISLRYANTKTLESGYGISLFPLATFATQTYKDDPCLNFGQKHSDSDITQHEKQIIAKMHKAITIIQLKLESQLVARNPDFGCEDRDLLSRINYKKGVVQIDGVNYELSDCSFPTVDKDNPIKLNEGEKVLIQKLREAFVSSSTLQRHIRFLFSHGSLYLVYNNNLLYHGCIPTNSDGTFYRKKIGGKHYKGRAYLDKLASMAHDGYFATDIAKKKVGIDTMWFLWSGNQSPLFGKDKMATFERYFIKDKTTHTERRNPYYAQRENQTMVKNILRHFGITSPNGKIINGHVPVKVKKGESPIKAGGKLLVIDGGFSRAYQKQTGIAGYTLIYNSYGLLLCSHYPFDITEAGIDNNDEIDTKTEIIEQSKARILTKETDQGLKIQRQLQDLNALSDAYRSGLIRERVKGDTLFVQC